MLAVSGPVLRDMDEVPVLLGPLACCMKCAPVYCDV
jgi:hypothetical protein